MIAGIYEIVHRESGRHYIGSAIDFAIRFSQHRYLLRRGSHHSPALQNAWNKYGEDAFDFRRIEVVAREKLIEREQYFIDTTKPYYNCAPAAGNRRGVKLSEKTRALISANSKRMCEDPEFRRRLGDGNRGRRLSPEESAQRSAALKESYALHPERREKIRQSLLKAYAEGRRLPNTGPRKPYRKRSKGGTQN